MLDNNDKTLYWNELFERANTLFMDATTKEYLWRPGEKIPAPRHEKTKEEQKDRTKKKAEVYTPSWVVKRMTDALDEECDDVYSKPNATFLEITCGEAPFITQRYEPDTGVPIPPADRFGVLDRKIKWARTNKMDNPDTYIEIIKSVYGYEYQVDSLLLARINVLQTMLEVLDESYLEALADIIHWNFFHMDGLKNVIPDTDTSPLVRFWSEGVTIPFKEIGDDDN